MRNNSQQRATMTAALSAILCTGAASAGIVSASTAKLRFTIEAYEVDGTPQSTKPANLSITPHLSGQTEPLWVQWGNATHAGGGSTSTDGNWGVGDGFTLMATSTTTASPNGYALCHAYASGEVTFTNISSTQTIFFGIKAKWDWTSKSLGDNPARDFGDSDPRISGSNVEGDTGTLVVYPQGGSLAGGSQRSAETTLGPGASWNFNYYCFAGTTASSGDIPAPDSIFALLGMAAARRRR